jgi:hypothetical protein
VFVLLQVLCWLHPALAEGAHQLPGLPLDLCRGRHAPYQQVTALTVPSAGSSVATEVALTAPAPGQTHASSTCNVTTSSALRLLWSLHRPGCGAWAVRAACTWAECAAAAREWVGCSPLTGAVMQSEEALVDYWLCWFVALMCYIERA